VPQKYDGVQQNEHELWTPVRVELSIHAVLSTGAKSQKKHTIMMTVDNL